MACTIAPYPSPPSFLLPEICFEKLSLSTIAQEVTSAAAAPVRTNRLFPSQTRTFLDVVLAQCFES